ncbi:hypothetical protein NQZ68_002029 [Dissostichus eleginoides]|nr:hypothetical protein NQZ68_002029 [Dissostichus eleginoides]
MPGDVITVADPDLPKLHRKSNFFRQIGSQLRTNQKKKKNKGRRPLRYKEGLSHYSCQMYEDTEGSWCDCYQKIPWMHQIGSSLVPQWGAVIHHYH